jgi:hypothetical protein
MHRCQHSFKKIPSNLWVVGVGSNSFQEISYAGKPHVVSSYILSNLCQNQSLKSVADVIKTFLAIVYATVVKFPGN